MSARVTNISWTGGFALRVHHGLRAIANDTGWTKQYSVNTLLFGDVWTGTEVPGLVSGLLRFTLGALAGPRPRLATGVA